MKIIQQIMLMVVAWSAFSCAPTPIYLLRPLAEDKRWLHGRELAYVTHAGYEVEVAFVRSAGRELIFEIWLRNNNTRAVEVAPERFYILSSTAATDSAIGAEGRHAIDPEVALLNLDKALAKNAASHKTEAALDLTVAVLDVVVELANAGKEKSQEEIEREEQERREEAEARREREFEHETKRARLQKEQAYWETQPLRKTTLAAKQTVEGYVHFPVIAQGRPAPYVKLVLPLNETKLVFVFEQQKIKL